MSDTTQDDREIDYDVQTGCGSCNNESFTIYDPENSDNAAIGCAELSDN